MHALVEAGGCHHLPGPGDKYGTSFIAGADSLHWKQTQNNLSIMLSHVLYILYFTSP